MRTKTNIKITAKNIFRRLNQFKFNKFNRKLLSFVISAVLILSAFVPVILSPMVSHAISRQISFNTIYQDSLESPASTNIYYFDTTSQGTVSVKFETFTGTNPTSWRVAITGMNNSAIYAIKDFRSAEALPEASSKVEYMDGISLPAGSYYISVSLPGNADFAMTPYKISVTFVSSAETGTATGSGNTMQTAAPMNLNITMTGNLKSRTDVNYFKITVPYHGALFLSFSVASSVNTGNWAVLLYDRNEKQLLMTQMGQGGQVINQIRTNKSDKLRLSPGEYYIKIATHSDSVFSNAEYKIYADYTPERSSMYEKEFNDHAEAATNIQINGPIIGNLSNIDDVDYFKFTVSDYKDLRIEFLTLDSINSNMWTIYIQDYKGGVATYHAGKEGAAINGKRTYVSPELHFEAGTYYIVVYAYKPDPAAAASYSNSDYTLLVHSDTAPTPSIQDSEYTYPTDVPVSAYNVNRDLENSIRSASDINNFEFGLNYSGLLSVSFIFPVSVTNQAWVLNIFDANHKLLYTGKYGAEGSPDAYYGTNMKSKTSDKIRVPAGSYYVQVLPINAYDYSSSPYRIKINYIAEAKEAMYSEIQMFETEYNDTPRTANPLIFDSPLTGNLSDYKDIDFFRFTLTKSSSVIASFATHIAVRQNNWVVELFSSESAVTPTHKYYFGAEGESENAYSNYKISFTKNMRLPPGTYYIKISAYNMINYSNEDYRIQIEFTNERPGVYLYETEPNNTPETANILPFNMDIIGDTFDINDIDYFKISAGSQKEIQIKFTVPSKTNAYLWSIKLYDSESRELKAYKVGEGGTPMSDGLKYFKTEKIQLNQGDYYISVSPYTKTEFSNEDYILKVLDEVGQRIDTYIYPADKPSSWAEYEVGFAYGYDLVPQNYMKNFRDPITREEFCILMIKFLEVTEQKPIVEILAQNNKTLNYNAFTDTSDGYILSANALGLVNGRGGGIFDPRGNITREEAATMLMRLGLFENIKFNVEPLKFNDSARFSVWAVNAIEFVSGCMDSRGNRIMNGYTDGGFHPNDSYSREQAFMTIFRLFALKMDV